MTQSTLNVIETVKTAWHKVSGSKKIFWAGLGLIILIRLILIALDKGSDYTGPGIIALFIALVSLAIIIIQTLLYWGLIYIGARRALDQPIQFDNYRYTFDFFLFLKMIGLYILTVLIMIIPFILIFIPLIFKDSHIIQLISPLFYLVGALLLIYLAVRLYLIKVLVVFKKMNPWTAIKLSFNATKGNVWRLIGLMLINLGILIVSIIPLGIGLIWSIPYLMINYGVVYKKLIEEK